MNDMPELQETTSTSVVIAVSKKRVYSMDNLDSAPSNGSHRRIGHFRVAFSLCFKVRLSAKSFI